MFFKLLWHSENISIWTLLIWISSTFPKTGAGEKYDLLGQKEEFRVNSQFALGTGMIGEELSAESELGQQSVSLCDDSGNNSVFFHEAQGNLLMGIDTKQSYFQLEKKTIIFYKLFAIDGFHSENKF